MAAFFPFEYAGPGISTVKPLAINYTIFRHNKVLGVTSADRGAGLSANLGANTISIRFSSFVGNTAEDAGGAVSFRNLGYL